VRISCNFVVNKYEAFSDNMEQADLWKIEMKTLTIPTAGLERS
jgi:hypothetical protein